MCLLVASAVMYEFARVMLACCRSVGMTWKGDVGGVTEIGGVEGQAEQELFRLERDMEGAC